MKNEKKLPEPPRAEPLCQCPGGEDCECCNPGCDCGCFEECPKAKRTVLVA